MEFPDGLKYSEEHTWVNVKDDIAKIGITDYASHELGSIIFVELPQIGDIIEQSESLGTLESSKTVSDIFAPVSGKVVEVNSDLETDPGIINEYPYEDGWLIKVELADDDELETLLDRSEYQTYVEDESDSPEDDDDDDDDDDSN